MSCHILLVCSDRSSHLICDLPPIFKKAGYKVSVLAEPHWTLEKNRFIDERIFAPSSAKKTLESLLEKTQTSHFDWILLGNDRLLWELVDCPLLESQKNALYPIGNPSYRKVLGGKIEMAAFFQHLLIPSPASRPVFNLQEAKTAFQKIGPPLLFKIPRSGAGEGVIKVEKQEDLDRLPFSFPLLAEKFLEGDLISVEPLFLKGTLVAYAYSQVLYTPTPFSPSLERLFFPCPQIEPILEKIGKELKFSGFASLSFIYQKSTNQHFLFECDLRPNRWIRYGSFVGVNWVEPLRLFPSFSILQKPQRSQQMCHFPADLQNALEKKNRARIFSWLFNRHGRWAHLPWKDPFFLFRGLFRLARKCVFQCR